MATVSVPEAKTHLSRLIERVLAGEEGVIARNKDPFDRLLIAQARIERVPLVSGDKLFDAFGVERIW